VSSRAWSSRFTVEALRLLVREHFRVAWGDVVEVEAPLAFAFLVRADEYGATFSTFPQRVRELVPVTVTVFALAVRRDWELPDPAALEVAFLLGDRVARAREPL
jgi:hypothetical protein